MKKRMMMVLALAMMIVVLAAGTAQAATLGPAKLTNTPDKKIVNAGQQVTFTIKETNISNHPIHGVVVKDHLGNLAQFVGARSSQGSCTYDSVLRQVRCNVGTLRPGQTAVIKVVVRAQRPGTMINNAFDNAGNKAPAYVEVRR
jgi:uncharacterized repeat protein (TIGR01451 family)